MPGEKYGARKCQGVLDTGSSLMRENPVDLADRCRKIKDLYIYIYYYDL